MIVDGQWQVGLNALSHEERQVNYGLAPVPPPSDHPEWASTTLVRGPVVVIPTGARDKEAAASLLAWMTSPEILTEAAWFNAMLPPSRTSAQDPRFRQVPNFDLFVDLVAHPNAKHVVTTSISPDLNEALGQVEEMLLHKGGNPVLLLDELQAELAPSFVEAGGYEGP